MHKLAIIDYDVGNIFSVEQACRKVGFDCVVSADPAAIGSADAIVLPGVGAFGDAMARLRERGLADAVHAFAGAGRPLLGICLGMQLLMGSSEEFGHHPGLGLVEGAVRRFPAGLPGVKVPQIQWNEVRFGPGGKLFAGMDSGVPMYFLHSYYVDPAPSGQFQASAEYGGLEYCCALERDNIFAVQFHPERSGEHGLEVFRNFKNLI
jgi:imidazole glycerol-phosphate synthase subunit HisH